MNIKFLHANYLDQPYEVSFETLARCNASCNFCPYPSLERQGAQLSDQEINRMLLEMREWPKPFYISPFKVNEPLLDGRFIRICQLINAYVPQATLRVFTNGSPLTVSRIHDIDMLNNVAHLWISLNSHLPDEYQNIMGLKFESTAGRLDQLHQLIEQGYFRHPVIVSKVSLLDDDHEFIQYCDRRWPLFEVVAIKQDGWLGHVPPSNPTIPDTPCARWFELSIMATGEVSLCCMDGKGEFCIGNIHKQSLLDIYNAPHWRLRREMMLSRKDIYPCSTCTY